MARPTLREWKQHLRQLRWERRLARAPYYRLILLLLGVLASGLLVLGISRG